MIVLRYFFSFRYKVIQGHTLRVHNIFLAKYIRKLFDLFQYLIVFFHQPGLLFFVFDRPGHVADKGKLAPEQMSVGLCIHQHTKSSHCALTAACKRASQIGAHTFVHLSVQIVDPVCQFCIFLLIFLHNCPTSL